MHRENVLAMVGALACCLVAVAPAQADHSAFEHASVGPTGGNAAQHVFAHWFSADGSRVFFKTSEALTADDTDTRGDLYEHVVGGATNLASTGPIGGNGAFDAHDFALPTPDGSHVLFQTAEQLVAADTDTGSDVYDRSGGTTTLVSTGPQSTFCFGNDNQPFGYAISPDGSRVLFSTTDRLTPDDTDCGTDIYERAGGTTTLVSRGSQAQAPNNFDPSTFVGASADRATVYFTSNLALEPSDTDSSGDIYKRAGGVTTLATTGPDGGNGAFNVSAVLGGFVSSDGDSLYFQTAESLVSADTDTEVDVYLRSGSTTSLVSQGPSGGNGAFPVTFRKASLDGSHAVFSTNESLVAADTDTRTDLYEYAGGTVQLVSTGPAGGNGAFDQNPNILMSDNGAHIIFLTAEKLVAADTDTVDDVYDRTGGTTSLVSPGTGNAFSSARAITPDGSRIFFETSERLVGADTDGLSDVYERAGNDVTLITPTPLGGNTSFGPSVQGVSQDGSRLFLSSGEWYAPSDTDNVVDVYVASTVPAPPAPGYARPKGATPLQLSLVPAYQACTSANRTHGPPLGFPSCNPPAQASGNLTVGTPDANGVAAASVGSVRFAVLAGEPTTMADEADVRVSFDLSDVRHRTGLADYTGELQSIATVRITDKRNGTGTDAGTVQDLPFAVTVPCSATAGAAGANCAVVTSFDAVLPGAIAEGRRSVWEFDRVLVNDGGADGMVATAPNDLFATQGIFVP